jgi:membrane-associated phospholipid phosphatase
VRWWRRADERLLRMVTSAGCGVLDEVMPRASRAADQLLIWWLIAAILAAAGDRRSRRAAGRAVAAMTVAGVAANVVRMWVFDRRRPPTSLHRRPGRVPDSPGFPSGHAAGAAAFGITLVCEAPWRVGVPVACLAAVVAYSRIYTGAHYPGDVAAGASAGAAIALGMRGIRGAIAEHPARDGKLW